MEVCHCSNCSIRAGAQVRRSALSGPHFQPSAPRSAISSSRDGSAGDSGFIESLNRTLILLSRRIYRPDFAKLPTQPGQRRNYLIYFALQRTGAGHTAARSCCNSSAAAENKCGAAWAPHSTCIARLAISPLACPRPRCAFCAFRASGTARAPSISQEQRSGRSAHRRGCPSPCTPPW